MLSFGGKTRRKEASRKTKSKWEGSSKTDNKK